MPLTRRASRLALILLPLPLLGSTCGPTTPTDAAPTGFVLDAGSTTAPLFIRVATDDAQPGWISVSHADGRRVYLNPRCDIGDCGKPPVVCGAAIPIVRDIATARSIEFTWDGMDSSLDATSGCERRAAAAAGAYVATFCYARSANLTGTGNPATGVQGSLTQPTCATVPFTWPASAAVRYQVP